MYFVFLLTIAIGAAYFLFAARRFDFLSVFFFAGVLYSSYAIVGSYDAGWLLFVYTTKAYAVLISFFIVLLIGTVAHDVICRGAAPPRGWDDSGARDWFALMAVGGVLLGAGCLAGTIWRDPQLMLTESNKNVMLEGMNDGRTYYYYKIFAVHAILAAYLSRRPFILAAATALGLCDLWLGFRFVTVMSVIGILVAESRRILVPLYRRWIFCAVGAAAAFFFVLVRRLYVAIRSQDLDRAAYDLEHYFRISVLEDNILVGEITGPTVLFLGSLDAEVNLGYQHVVAALRSLVPLLGRLGDEFVTFNTYVQEPVLGVSREWFGMAESNFGSWHAVGGIFGVMLFSCCYTSLVIVLALLMRRARLSCTLYLTWLPILTFYNFRNDFYHMAGYSRLVVMTWLLLAAFAAVVLAWDPSRRGPIKDAGISRIPALLPPAPRSTRTSPSPG